MQSLADDTIQTACMQTQEIDFYEWVSNFAIGAIGRCFVGIENPNGIPPQAFKIFLHARHDITRASLDHLSRFFGPLVRLKFRRTKRKMDALWAQILKDNLDAICLGDNYVWDLAIDRARQLYPELEADALTASARGLIQSDKWVRESGPTTIFATMNVGRSICLMLDMLKQHPEAWDKLRAEVQEVIGNAAFGPSHLEKLPCSTLCCADDETIYRYACAARVLACSKRRCDLYARVWWLGTYLRPKKPDFGRDFLRALSHARQ